VGELVVHVFRLNGLLIALGDGMAEPSGQTSARWRVLAAIDEKPLSVAQIARAWWLTRQSVQRVADVLVEDGLATYEDNPNHRRAKLVRITPRGLSALRGIRLRQRTWADALGEEIGEPELREANATLANVLEALTKP
jgi:DNA-binding MarR family transcriptional regulator